MNIGCWSASDVADKLSKSGRQKKQKTGDGWKVCCPSHNDQTPSLSLKDGKKGLVYYCFGGCSQEDVRRSLEAILGGMDAPERKKTATREKVEDSRLAIVPVPEEVNVSIDDFMHSTLGSPSRIWSYKTEDGKPAGWVARYETEDGKEIIPWCWMKRPEERRGRLTAKALPSLRPLYNLDKISKDKIRPILWSEGEKAADASEKLFPNWIATATQGGGNAVRLSNYTPLTGRMLIITPDHDGPGYQAAAEIARITGKNVDLRMLVWPQRWPKGLNDERSGRPYTMKKGDDIDDHVKRGWTREALKMAVDEGHKLVHHYYLLEDGFEAIYYDYEAEKRIQSK